MSPRRGRHVSYRICRDPSLQRIRTRSRLWLRLPVSGWSRLRVPLPRQLVEVAHAETVVGPLLVEDGAEALPHRRPLAYGGHPSSSGTGAVCASCSGVTSASHASISDACRSRTPSTSSRLGRADGSSPCSSWSVHERRSQTHGRERLGQPEHAASEPRVVHEDEVTQGLDHRPLAVDAVMLAALGHGPDPLDGRGPVVPQLPPGLRRSAGSSDRISSRTGCRRSSSASTYGMTSTPLTTRLVTRPSISASCMTTPTSRALLRSHSRNSAPVRSSSSKRRMRTG